MRLYRDNGQDKFKNIPELDEERKKQNLVKYLKMIDYQSL